MRAAALVVALVLAVPAHAADVRLDRYCPGVAKIQHPTGTSALVIVCTNGYTVTVRDAYRAGKTCGAKRDAFGNVSIICA